MAVGDKIKWLRKLSHVPQQYVADQLKIDRATLTKYENEKKNPKDNTIEGIANALEVNPDSIVSEKMDTPSRAMHCLFGFSRRFGLSFQEIDGNYYITFPKLQPFINAWIKKLTHFSKNPHDNDSKIGSLWRDPMLTGSSLQGQKLELWEAKFPQSAFDESLANEKQWREIEKKTEDYNNREKDLHVKLIVENKIEEDYVSVNGNLQMIASADEFKKLAKKKDSSSTT